MAGCLIWALLLAKSFYLPFAKQILLFRSQPGLRSSRWGLKMSTVIPEKCSVESCDRCQSRLHHFSDFRLRIGSDANDLVI